MENRVVWIDFAKVLGIFLVILAHTPLLKSAETFIYVFHMPLFFFISGFLFSFDKYTNYKSFLLVRFKQLVVPYFIFNAITYLFWIFIGSKFGNDASLDIKWYLPIIGMFYSKGSNPWLTHCIPLWFIGCLFVVENLYYWFFKHKNRSLMLLFFGFIGFIDYLFDPIRFPWSFNIALVAIVFYSCGNFIKDHLSKCAKLRNSYLVGLSVFSFIVVTFVAFVNGKIAMHTHNYGNYLYFFVGGFSGIIGIYSLSVFLHNKYNSVFWIEYISKNTIVILAFHLMVGSFIKGFIYFVLGFPLGVFDNVFWLNLVFSIFSLLLVIPIIFLINRFTPFVVGKGRYYFFV